MQNFSYVYDLSPSDLTGILVDAFLEDIEGVVLLYLTHSFMTYGSHQIKALFSLAEKPEIEVPVFVLTENTRLIDDWGCSEEECSHFKNNNEVLKTALSLVLDNEYNKEVLNEKLLSNIEN